MDSSKAARTAGSSAARARPGRRGHPDLLQPHTVEPLGEVDQRRVAPMMHVLADRAHLVQGGRDVEVGSGQQVAQGGALGEGVAAQIDSGDHGTDSQTRVGCSARIDG
ncbi:hypothetical protein SFUMM280S_05799 [Streptomyces fumanus]